MNFRVFDLRKSFGLEEASLAWAGQERIEGYGIGESETVLRALIEAAESGELPVKKVHTKDSGSSLGVIKGGEVNWRESEVSREDLLTFAHQRDQRPKFLFPEQREYGEGIPALEKTRKLKKNQVDRLLVQAVALTLWDENPDFKIDRLVHHRAIREYGNGRQWGEKAVREWIAAVDPREESSKPGPNSSRK